MSGSAAYYAEYLKHLALADKYQRWMDELNKIRRAIQNNFSDDISDVNTRIADLQEDLRDSVKHERVFNDSADDLSRKLEKQVGNDPNLSSALSSLQAEVQRLIGLKQQEEAAAQTAYENYQAALRAEEEAMQAAMQSMKKG